MRVSDDQVKRSLAALTADPGDVGEERLAGDEIAMDHDLSGRVPAQVVAALGRGPRVREAEVARVRALLEEGEAPTSEDVATKLIGRMVCDRLR